MADKKMMVRVAKSVAVFILAILLALALDEVGLRAENIFLVFVVGVLIIIVETASFVWGIVSAILFILSFNFFFTDPRYTLNVDDPNYLVSFLIFFIVAGITATLTSRLHKQMRLARYNAVISEKLHEISKGFLYLNEEAEIVKYAEQAIKSLLERDTALFIINKQQDLNVFKPEVVWCYENSFACGSGEAVFGKDSRKYLPIRSENSTLGVVCVDCTHKPFGAQDEQYLHTILFQLTIALERHWLNMSEEENRIKIERENLRSNLLRSISHDLRTPLTGIAGGSGFLLESMQELDEDTVRSVLRDIYSDALWLSGLVENLLNMTRIQDGRLVVSKKKEVVDDVVAEAMDKVAKRSGKHTLAVQRPSEVLLVPMDAQLIIQVLINILDNAFRHTPVGSNVQISYDTNADNLLLEISDNGGGIKAERLSQVFEPFFTTLNKSADKQRGMGLGLNICKSIIEAHGGKITAYNNENGGATFRIELPLE